MTELGSDIGGIISTVPGDEVATRITSIIASRLEHVDAKKAVGAFCDLADRQIELAFPDYDAESSPMLSEIAKGWMLSKGEDPTGIDLLEPRNVISELRIFAETGAADYGKLKEYGTHYTRDEEVSKQQGFRMRQIYAFGALGFACQGLFHHSRGDKVWADYLAQAFLYLGYAASDIPEEEDMTEELERCLLEEVVPALEAL